jgi:hypothetical protein
LFNTLFMCRVNSQKANYRNITVEIVVIILRQTEAYMLTSRTNTYIYTLKILLFLPYLRKHTNIKNKKI